MDKIPFETYEKIAREVAERIGNPFLVGIILNAYLDVARTRTYYPLDRAEYSRVIRALRELEPIALESGRRKREAIEALDRQLGVLETIFTH